MTTPNEKLFPGIKTSGPGYGVPLETHVADALGTLARGAVNMNPIYRGYEHVQENRRQFYEKSAARLGSLDAAQAQNAQSVASLPGTEEPLNELATPYMDVVRELEAPQGPASTDVTAPEGTVIAPPDPDEAQARVFAAALTGNEQMYREYAAELNRAQAVANKGFSAEATALNARATLELNKGVILASKQQDRADELAEERQQIEDSEKLRTEALEDANIDIQDAESAVANFEIDTKRIFPTAAHAFGSALAVALGGFGSSLTGAENTAFKIIDKAISRDIAAQRTELSKLQYMVGRKDSQYQKLLAVHKDQRVVESLMRAQADKLFELEINRLETMYGGMINQQTVAAMRGQLEQRRGAGLSNLANHKYNGRMKNYALNIQAQAANARAKAAKQANALKGFKDADTRTKMSATIAAKDQLAQAEKALEQMELNPVVGAIAQYGPWYTDEDRYHEKMRKLALSLITMQSGASFTDVSYDEILKGLPEHGDFKETKREKLLEVRNMLEAKMLGNYQVLSPQEKGYYREVFNGPPKRFNVAQGSAGIRALGQRQAGAVGPDR